MRYLGPAQTTYGDLVSKEKNKRQTKTAYHIWDENVLKAVFEYVYRRTRQPPQQKSKGCTPRRRSFPLSGGPTSVRTAAGLTNAGDCRGHLWGDGVSVMCGHHIASLFNQMEQQVFLNSSRCWHIWCSVVSPFRSEIPISFSIYFFFCVCDRISGSLGYP